MMDGKRNCYMIDPEKITIAYPVMISAYPEGEEEHAVPVDVIEIDNYSDQKALVLPEGSYVVRFTISKEILSG